jgi:uncharacterized membrane protein
MSNKFSYSYSAPTEEERREIASIRKDYLVHQQGDSKLERLRKLDKKVKTSPMILSMSIGVVGILVFGFGLSLCLVWGNYIWGILLAVLGCVPMAFAYPAYKWLLAKNKAKYGGEIIRLSEELLNENNQNNKD